MIEYVATIVIGGATTLGGLTFLLKKYFDDKKTLGHLKSKPTSGRDEFDAWPFLLQWHNNVINVSENRVHNKYGICCPKCDNVFSLKENKLCACETHPSEHFHFQCDVCEYKGLMRTKDN